MIVLVYLLIHQKLKRKTLNITNDTLWIDNAINSKDDNHGVSGHNWGTSLPFYPWASKRV